MFIIFILLVKVHSQVRWCNSRKPSYNIFMYKLIMEQIRYSFFCSFLKITFPSILALYMQIVEY